MKRSLLFLSLSLAIAGILSAAESPLTPAQALASFKLEPGLRAGLAAAEPLVASPCALAFDERGRLFVAENRGYPTGGREGEAAGIIALLEDADGDGRFEKRTVFADGLTFPNGVLPWKGGLFVTCAPDLLYLKDTDGDGRADERRVVLTGFSTNGSTQLRVSHPTLGPDGWIYLTSGLTGGKIRVPEHPERAAFETGSDVKFHPETLEVQSADGRGQFGQSFDDFGRRFVCMNRVQVQHVVLSSRDLKRNPNLAFAETMQNCPDLVPNLFMQAGGGAARIFPISVNVTTADSHAGTFTAACAVHVYRGDALPMPYRGCAFSCDPTGNLVHYDRLEPQGATFAALRVRDGVEFLASPDAWFRPVFLATGPDGALYLCDMYRKTIEHPDYLPVELRKHTDFESGKEMGRIWRVAAAEIRPVAKQIAFASMTPRQLVQELGSPNGWRRDTAFRLLVERNERDDLAPLRSLATSKASPAAVAASLHLLDSHPALSEAILLRALRHSDAGVREVAARLAARQLATSNILSRVRALADDPAPRVRFQCALTLGGSASPRTTDALARIATRDGADRWTRAAVLSSVAGREELFLEDLFAQRTAERESFNTLLGETARLFGASREKEALPDAINTLARLSGTNDFAVQAELFNGFGRSLRGRLDTKPGQSALTTLLAKADVETAVVEGSLWLFKQAKQVALDAAQPAGTRAAAVALLGQTDFAHAGNALLALLDTKESAPLHPAAIRALGELNDPAVPRELLAVARWKTYTPASRETVLTTVLAQPRLAAGVLDALESGAFPPASIDAARREPLLKHRDPALRARAEALFKNLGGDRMKAFEESKPALTLKPVPANGREVFKRACANCHRLEREGVAVGPDLFGIRNQPKETILLHIVVPEYELAPNFVNYTVETRDGRTLSGLLAGETPGSVTLRQSLGVEEKILRRDLVNLTASALSLMPQELEKTMTRQELADLLAWLKGEAE